ncbi:MAG: HAD-IA family hydrolase [Saprospiraceae bacterium]|nr:HAD-IA family hydrolase [Saprospiraceae bacterium]
MQIKKRLLSAEAYIFDFYGTLVEIDYEPPQMWETLRNLGFDCYLAMQEMWEADGFDGCLTPSYNSTPSYQDWRKNNIIQLIKQSGVPIDRIDEVYNCLLEVEKTATKKAVFGANSVIQLLRKHNKKIGLCSNWDFPIQPYLEQTGLPLFDAISVSAEVGARKPNSKIFNDICSKLSVNPSKAIFIGDNWVNDVVGAMRCELFPVWIRFDNPTCGMPNHVLEFESLRDFEKELELIFR